MSSPTHDELPAHEQIVDGAAVVGGVDDGRGVRRQPPQILRHRQIRRDRLRGLEEGSERDRRRLLARADQLGRHLVDAGVHRIEEVLGQRESSRHGRAPRC